MHDRKRPNLKTDFRDFGHFDDFERFWVIFGNILGVKNPKISKVSLGPTPTTKAEEFQKSQKSTENGPKYPGDKSQPHPSTS